MIPTFSICHLLWLEKQPKNVATTIRERAKKIRIDIYKYLRRWFNMVIGYASEMWFSSYLFSCWIFFHCALCIFVVRRVFSTCRKQKEHIESTWIQIKLESTRYHQHKICELNLFAYAWLCVYFIKSGATKHLLETMREFIDKIYINLGSFQNVLM